MPRSQAGRWHLRATKRRATRRPRVEELEGRLAPAAPSSNWAGYAVATGPGAVTAVRGTWVVPPVSGAGTAASSAWVGIDGFRSPTVEQIGTDADLVFGMPLYFAWYELFPRDRVIVKGMVIRPGDTMAGEVRDAGPGLFRLRLTDLSTGKSYATTQAFPGAERSSAEWVVEGHEARRGGFPLADFGTVTFSGASVTVGRTAGPIDRIPRRVRALDLTFPFQAGATPSGLTDSGGGQTSSFTVTYDPPGG